MKDKKHPTESTYQTGSTCPPKSHGGIIAFLLVLVIFLSGISTALGLMNIRLFKKLSVMEATQPSPVAFSRGSRPERSGTALQYPLGFAGQEVSDFWQTYHQLPKGIYVVEVTSGEVSDLLPGDIITHIDGAEITSIADFDSMLKNYQPGESVDVVLFRNGESIPITLTMQED